MIATLDDWLELLGLDAAVDSLLQGTTSITDVRAAIETARDVYPQVAHDYVVVLGRVDTLLDDVQAVIDKQADAVRNFNRIVEDFGFHFEHDDKRLLSEADRADLTAIHDQLFAKFAELRAEAQRLEEEAADIAEQIEDLAASIEGNPDDPFLELELEALQAELEEAFQALVENDCIGS